LQRALVSLQDAIRPDGLEIVVVVVDNNSRDETARIVREFSESSSLPIRYLLETGQGSSFALNAGIAASTGDLVAMINDDEEIDPSWFEVIVRNFADPTLDFLGGACAGRWDSPAPDWLPPDYPAVIGIVDGSPERTTYGDGYHGMLMGGNAVIRRRVLERVGPYNTALGRTAVGLLSCEDEDMYLRLRASGARGIYDPALIIRHYIAPERLTKRYHRRWCYGQGVSRGVLDRGTPQDVVYLGGIPRYMIGDTLRAVFRWMAVHRREPAARFGAELRVWQFAGFVVGRFFKRA
jgi:glycosyltransferase involved in cell wall biosynthesis